MVMENKKPSNLPKKEDKPSNSEIKEHYLRDPVKNTVLRSAEYNGSSRIAIFDNNKFYDPEKSQKNLNKFYHKEKKHESLVKLFRGNDTQQYPNFINTMERVYYLTLNYLPLGHHRFQEYY